MSIPNKDPLFTIEELRKVGQTLLDASYNYWEAAQKAGIGGACIWLEDADGKLVIFTRGEYRETLMRGIDKIGPIKTFGCATDE